MCNLLILKANIGTDTNCFPGANDTGETFGRAEDHNFNMQTMQNGWPAERGLKADWKHSDIKDIAYLYVYKLFNELVGKGGLNQ